VFFHQRGRNLVLGPEFPFQGGDAFLGALTARIGREVILEGGGSILDELLQSTVKDRRTKAEFFTEIGNWNLPEEAPTQDGSLFFRGTALALCAVQVSSPL
jgi:hypothetical protein